MAFQHKEEHYTSPTTGSSSVNCSDDEADQLWTECLDLNPAPKRILSEATNYDLGRMKKTWESFCQQVLAKKDDSYIDPMGSLRELNPRKLMTFFSWYCKRYSARRLNTYDAKWRRLRQLYYNEFREKVDEKISTAVNNYIRGELKERYLLVPGNRAKPTIGPAGLNAALCYHWRYDTEVFAHERQRVQLATILLLIAYTTSRPGALVVSGHEGIRTSATAHTQTLTYRNVALYLLRTPVGQADLLVLELTLMWMKGKRHRSEPTSFSVYEQDDNLIMCPVLHFLALAFTDQAFLNPHLTPANLRKVSVPAHQGKVKIPWKESILDTPVFRAIEENGAGCRALDAKPIQYEDLRSYFKRLGERVGSEFFLHPYCIRRFAATAIDDSGASVAQRSQALGHSRADTYKHYQSQKVTIDVQSIFNYSDSKAEMIKEHGQTYLHRGAPTRLDASQKQVISEDPAIQLTRRQRAQLRLNLTDRYDGWKKAKADPAASAEVAEWKRLGSQIGNTTTRSRKLAFRGSLAQFHTMADVQLVSAQIKDESIPEVSPPIDASEHSIPERRWLAKNLPGWIENLGFEQLSPIELKISALEQMSQLCSLYERRKPRSSTPDSAAPLTLTTGPPATDYPTQLPPTTCLHCLGDDQLAAAQRIYVYAQRRSLQTHYARKYLPFIEKASSLTCPHPRCPERLNGWMHFQTHADRVHGVRM
ncbi:MAG: hypothetical protein LQ347_002588 [Umbilicaria vellea]|nr:MAG: hypothetical protein LQ347_002588 [Umbilicaria vellea]